MIRFLEVTDQNGKSKICESILRALPDWFGIEASIVDYARDVRDMPFIVAMDGDAPVGFVAIKRHNPYTAEVCVMGILQTHHRHGIGRRLIERCEQFCAEQRIEFLTVKTLAPSHPDQYYARTRRFYEAMGFRPLEVFPLLWDEANPCLMMAKYVGV